MTDSEFTAAPPSKSKVLTLANQITILRILLIPVVVIGMLERMPGWAYGILIFSMLTDFLDGVAARQRGERTRLGAFLDPMADKLLLTSVFITLTFLRQIPTWVFVVVFARDMLIVLGWSVIYILTGSSDIKPRPLGKATTVAQMSTALACMIALPIGITNWFIWITMALTIGSAFDYVYVGQKRLGEWA